MVAGRSPTSSKTDELLSDLDGSLIQRPFSRNPLCTVSVQYHPPPTSAVTVVVDAVNLHHKSLLKVVKWLLLNLPYIDHSDSSQSGLPLVLLTPISAAPSVTRSPLLTISQYFKVFINLWYYKQRKLFNKEGKFISINNSKVVSLYSMYFPFLIISITGVPSRLQRLVFVLFNGCRPLLQAPSGVELGTWRRGWTIWGPCGRWMPAAATTTSVLTTLSQAKPDTTSATTPPSPCEEGGRGAWRLN